MGVAYSPRNGQGWFGGVLCSARDPCSARVSKGLRFGGVEAAPSSKSWNAIRSRRIKANLKLAEMFRQDA